MTTETYWLGVACGLLLIAFVFELVRRRYLRGRFALVWLATGTGAALLALAPRLLERAADIAGVQVPLNLLLFLGSMAMLVLLIQLSVEVGRLYERTRVLAEEVAMLRCTKSGELGRQAEIPSVASGPDSQQTGLARPKNPRRQAAHHSLPYHVD